MKDYPSLRSVLLALLLPILAGFAGLVSAVPAALAVSPPELAVHMDRVLHVARAVDAPTGRLVVLEAFTERAALHDRYTGGGFTFGVLHLPL